MSVIEAKAYPRKHFFVEMFTRDISLSDCILDLIDNSIDGYTRRNNLDLGKELLEPFSADIMRKTKLPTVSIRYNADLFEIEDNCGGIDLDRARNEVFNFGYSVDHDGSGQHQLGVYGIGLKRALFKIGRKFSIKSKTTKNGFETVVDLDEWTARDSSLKDWTFELTTRSAAARASEAGTHISICQLRDEVRTALSDPTFTGRLIKTIAQVYALFLGRHVQISVNNVHVDPETIPLGHSDEITPAKSTFHYGSVAVHLFASIAARDANHSWKQEHAGWYVGCNGRLVVTADRTELTGWGIGALPAFHSKYRGFVGLALFQSQDPLLLPWRTSKRGLNQESLVYQKARTQMNASARPILSFLDKMYPSDLSEHPRERVIASNSEALDVRTLTNGTDNTFVVKPRRRTPDAKTVRVQYDAHRGDIEAIKKQLRLPDFSASQVGKYTFEAYLKNEISK